MEGTDIRKLENTRLPARPDVVVIDVSFISLKLVLPPVLSLAAAPMHLLALIKPQFEAGRAAIGKGGIVRDKIAREAVLAGITDFIAAQAGWRCLASIDSPIAGGDGNVEYLLAAIKQ